MPEKIIIGISVEKKIAKADENAVIVCGNSNYKAVFAFDSEWADYPVKTALFATDNKGGTDENNTIPVVFDGNECDIPQLANTTIVGVGVVSGDLTVGDQVEVSTTTPAYIPCLISIKDLGGVIAPPAPDVYDQIIALLNKYIQQGGGGGSGGTDEERVREIVAEETADLQAKTDESLETEDKTVVGAINELKGENEDIVTELAVINTVLEQSGLVAKYKATIEDTYTERVTADGANVLDGSKAKLEKVVGSTVACKQLFDISKISEASNLSKTNSDIVVTNSYGTGSNKNVKELFPAVKAGITYTVACTVEANAPSYASNGMITALGGTNILAPHYFESAGSAYVKQAVVFTEEDLTRQVFFYGLADGGTGVANSTVKWKNLMLVEGDYTNTEMPPYQPYFTGLKSASFAGIESKNADGTETSTLAFPKTETPLGVTIDFEAKKITDYGVEIVLTGSEITNFSEYTNVGKGVVFNGLTPKVEVDPKGVFTDGKVVTYLAKGGLRIGLGTNLATQNCYWYGILDTLGFTESWVDKDNPTAEEKSTAIASFKAYLAQRYADGNPVTIRYVSSTLQSEKDFTAENEYTAYKGGAEKVLDNDGKDYGADNTLSQNYIIVTGVK